MFSQKKVYQLVYRCSESDSFQRRATSREYKLGWVAQTTCMSCKCLSRTYMFVSGGDDDVDDVDI